MTKLGLSRSLIGSRDVRVSVVSMSKLISIGRNSTTRNRRGTEVVLRL